MVAGVRATVERVWRHGPNVRKLYALAVPREWGEPPHLRLAGWLVADYGESLAHGRRTAVYVSNAAAEPLDWAPVWESRFDAVSDDAAMAALGYEVVG